MLLQAQVLAWYFLAAACEVAGCFTFWAVVRGGRSAWWLAAGLASLAVFALALTRVDVPSAGRAFAAYGGIYIAASLAWLRLFEGVPLDRWDICGGLVCIAGAAIIAFGPR